MNVRLLEPAVSTRVLFKRTSGLFVPGEPGCYVLATFDGSVLYIGLTKKLKRRFEDHLDTDQKVSPTTDGKAVWFHFLICREDQLEFFERSWLEQYRNAEGKLPLLNKVRSPVS